MSVLNDSVLVLNQSWRPVHTTTVRDAVTLIFHDTARVVDPRSYATYDFASWTEAAEFAKASTRSVRAYRWEAPVPEVIVLSRYNGFRKRGLTVNRRNLFARDRNQCQYCGRKFKSEDLTLDHALPRSRGGASTWENLVVACVDCNQKKANRTPREAGMKLQRKPARPSFHAISLGRGPRPESWEAFLSDLYWTTELE